MYRSRLALVPAMVATAAVLVPSFLTAQMTFQRTYGGGHDDIGYSVQQTADGGYIVVGTTVSYGAGGGDVYLVRTDGSGDTLWTRTYGGTSRDDGYLVQQTADSGYIIVGLTESYGAGSADIYLVKTDASGDTLWTRAYGGPRFDEGYAVQQTPDGGYVVAGAVCLASDTEDVYLMRTDPSGDTLWTRTYGGSGFDEGNALGATTDGGYIIAGITKSFGLVSADVYLLKTDSSGDTLWTRTYGGPGYDEAYSVQQTADGGYIVAGIFGSESSDVYLLKTNASGDTLWTRTYNGWGKDKAYSVQQTTDGGFIITGFTASSYNDDVYLIKTDVVGDTEWTRTFGEARDDVGYSVRQTADGGCVVSGLTYSFGVSGSDVYLIKTDSLGNVASVEEPKTGPVRIAALLLTCEPNPCRGATMVSFQSQATSSVPLTLCVYDVTGRTILSRTLAVRGVGTEAIDLRGLKAGVYMVKIKADDFISTQKLVVER
jgi:hypothetical protein